MFLLSFIWLRYFTHKLWLSVLLGVVITAIFDIIGRLINKKRKSVFSLKIKEKEEAENIFLSLAASQNYLPFFEKLALKENPAARKKDGYIILERQKRKVLLCPILTLDPLSIDSIAQVYLAGKKENATKIVLVVGEISKEMTTFTRSLDTEIVLLDKFMTYSMLYKYYNTFPEITIKYQKSKKLAARDLLSYAFNRSRTKGYLFSALILLLSSIFMRLNLYYALFSSTLVLFAIFSYFNTSFNKNPNKILLE